MASVAVAAAAVVAGVNALAALVGGVQWWRVVPSRAFWLLCRGGQAVAVAQALAAGVLALSGFDPAAGLYWLYALLPVAVGFFAEQLRLLSAREVLDRRGLEDARAMERLAEREQRSVVLEIVRREMGVMAVAAAVTVFLAWRALLVV